MAAMTEPIFAAVEHDLQRAWDAFASHTHHAHYHDPQNPATPATEAPMSLIQTLETDFEDVRAKVEEFAKSKLPAALADAKSLEGNPVVDALLGAAHVPVEALTMVVSVIQHLEELYAPQTNVPQPAEVPVTTEPAEPAQAVPAA